MLHSRPRGSAAVLSPLRALAFGLALATLPFALAACGKKETASKDASGAIAKNTVIDTAGEFDPIANTDAVPGGTFTTWGGPSPKSLNMWLDYTSFAKSVMDLTYESLVSLHSVEDRPVGVLAESWEISEDGKTFTFKLDPRARWSDGKPVTTRD